MGECSCRDKVMADGAINLEMLDFVMAGLMKDYFGNKDQIKELICEVGPDLNEKVAKCILYADCVCGNPEARNHRFSLFVMMYEASERLRNDDSLAYDLFMVAYQNSSNIYKQLQDTPFDVRGFFGKVSAIVPVSGKLDEISGTWFNGLPNVFTVYRGLSKAEKDEGNIGISWTTDDTYAEKYLYLKDNEVKGNVGYVAEMRIEKSDVIAVLYEYHEDVTCFEIITLKQENVTFREVKL